MPGRSGLVVVSDAFHPTETTLAADVLFPAAAWGEKEWTSTSSERLVSYSPKLFDPPGTALPVPPALTFSRGPTRSGASPGCAESL